MTHKDKLLELPIVEVDAKKVSYSFVPLGLTTTNQAFITSRNIEPWSYLWDTFEPSRYFLFAVVNLAT